MPSNNQIENYLYVLEQLKVAVELYRNHPENDLYRDGLLRRFVLTAELSWKFLQRYLEDQGVISGETPKFILKEAYSAGFIQDEVVWLSVLHDWNQVPYAYVEETAKEIAQRICETFLPVFQALAAFYRENS